MKLTVVRAIPLTLVIAVATFVLSGVPGFKNAPTTASTPWSARSPGSAS